MSDNNGTDEGKLRIQCPSCNKVFFANMRQVELSNNLRSSTATLVHDSIVRCPRANCSQAFVMLITGVQLAIGAQPVGEDVVQQVEGSPIIKPVLGLVN